MLEGADWLGPSALKPESPLESCALTARRDRAARSLAHPRLLYLDQYTNFFSLLLIAGGVLCFIAYSEGQHMHACWPTEPSRTRACLSLHMQ
jgi:hypothetical protein